LSFCYIVDFPLFEWKKQEGRWHYMHHPFTAPQAKDIPLLDKEPGKAHSYQHDLILNGYEVGGGSLRITDPEIQKKVFKLLGHSEKEIERKFKHLLKAFEYGVPPHGGIAPGIDRFLMVALGEPSLREVMAFPITAGGQTAVMKAPSPVDAATLAGLGIKVIKTKKTSRKPLFDRVIGLLERESLEYKIYEHRPVKTSRAAAAVRGTKLEQGAKALVMLADKTPVLVVLSAADKLDSKKFKRVFGVKDLRMATPEEVKKLTGVVIGAVPPFGNLMGLKTYVDKGLGKNKEIVFNAGSRAKSVKVSFQKWQRLVGPEEGDLAVSS
jgi:prolyl-tRNA editing enzyme YbaK/EbsC (Cys-tRNA(Pro) deacylase)